MESAVVITDRKSAPSIFEYDDYRAFLRDFYRFQKERSRTFSFRYFSRRAGFASPNFLKLVMEGKRNLSLESVSRFVDALKLSRTEAEFFHHLVGFSQAKSPDERAEYASKILRSKGYQKMYPLQQAEFSYYACWFYIPVRELVALSFFREDPEWVAKTVFPQISAEEARRALSDLEALGLLRRESGRLVQNTRTVTTANEVTSASIVGYHREMLNRASESIETVRRERREISAACIPVSEAVASEIKRRLQEFRNEILALAGEDTKPDRVYQLGLQLFPISRLPDESEA